VEKMIKLTLDGKETRYSEDKIKKLMDVIKGNYQLLGVSDSTEQNEEYTCVIDAEYANYKACFGQLM
jgi:aerobic-type carbon monoxide dehydrogenase small subunit (CoxS/CutS family)